MGKQASTMWKRLRRSLTAHPARFAGGSAVSGPLGLLAVEQERLRGRPVLAPQEGTQGATGYAAAYSGGHGVRRAG
jgi:hypothetical protein